MSHCRPTAHPRVSTALILFMKRWPPAGLTHAMINTSESIKFKGMEDFDTITCLYHVYQLPPRSPKVLREFPLETNNDGCPPRLIFQWPVMALFWWRQNQGGKEGTQKKFGKRQLCSHFLTADGCSQITLRANATSGTLRACRQGSCLLLIVLFRFLLQWQTVHLFHALIRWAAGFTTLPVQGMICSSLSRPLPVPRPSTHTPCVSE